MQSEYNEGAAMLKVLDTTGIARAANAAEPFIKAHLAQGHVDLVETLAEDIAALCLAYDRAEQVCVAVAKLEAFEEAQAVGVRITRRH